MSGFLQRVGYGQSPARFVWAGNVRDDGFDVCCEVIHEAEVVLQVMNPASPQVVLFESDEVDTVPAYRRRISLGSNCDLLNHNAKVSCIGELDPDTIYPYRLKVDGKIYPNDVYYCRTFPTEGDPADVDVIGVSCNDTSRSARFPAYRAIRALAPHLLLHAGDIDYSDITATTGLDARRRNDRLIRSVYDFRDCMRSIPIARIADDHDIGSNNITTETADAAVIMRAARDASLESFPHYPWANIELGEDDPTKYVMTQVINIARVRLMLIDCRSQKSPTANTMLGAGAANWDQVAFVKAQALEAGNDGCVLFVPMFGTSWTNVSGEADSWDGGDYEAERAEIDGYWRDTPGCPQIVVWQGDPHESSHCDGLQSEAQYSGGGSTMPQFVTSPLYRSSNLDYIGFDPTWNGVTRRIKTGQPSMFGRLQVFDTPPTKPSFSYKTYGGPIDGDAGTATELMADASDDETPELEFGGTEVNATAGAAISLPFAKNDWFGPIDEVKASGGTGEVDISSGADSDTVPIRPNSAAWNYNTTNILGPTAGTTKTVDLDGTPDGEFTIGSVDSITVYGRTAEAMALYGAATVKPTIARMTLIDTLVSALKTAGVWTKLDELYLLAAHDSQFGRLNWKAPTNANSTLTAFNSPTFTTDRGFTGNGSSAYLANTVNRSALTQLQQNSAHIGLRCLSGTRNDDPTVGNGVSTTNGVYLVPCRLSSDAMRGRVCDGTTANSTTAETVVTGHKMLRRGGATAATHKEYFKNAASHGSVAAASTGVAATPLNILGNVAGLGYTDHQVCLVHVGGYLDNTEISALRTACDTYLTALGCTV